MGPPGPPKSDINKQQSYSPTKFPNEYLFALEWPTTSVMPGGATQSTVEGIKKQTFAKLYHIYARRNKANTPECEIYHSNQPREHIKGTASHVRCRVMEAITRHTHTTSSHSDSSVELAAEQSTHHKQSNIQAP